MTIFLLLCAIVLIVFPPLRRLLIACLIGVLMMAAYPVVKVRSLLKANTGPGKFMQPGQGPILLMLILLVPCILVAVVIGLSQM